MFHFYENIFYYLFKLEMMKNIFDDKSLNVSIVIYYIIYITEVYTQNSIYLL